MLSVDMVSTPFPEQNILLKKDKDKDKYTDKDKDKDKDNDKDKCVCWYGQHTLPWAEHFAGDRWNYAPIAVW